MFNLHSLRAITSGGDDAIIKWCQTAGLLRRDRTCDVCGGEARIYHRRTGTGHSRWRCFKGSSRGRPHSWEESVAKDTIFEGTKFGIARVLRFFYFFAHGFTKYSDLIRETSTVDETTSDSTVSQWLTYCRKVCSTWMDRKFGEDKLGGSGMTVQIGETTIGKRKSISIGSDSSTIVGAKRRATEDQWVVGIIEIRAVLKTATSIVDDELNQTDDKLELGSKVGRFRVEVCPDNVRDESTLASLICKHVRPGSMVMTDCWPSTYAPLETHGPYQRLDVDTSQWHIIESFWKSLKKEVCRSGNRGINDNLSDHLCELMWRREIKQDRFLGFVQCAVEVYNLY